MEKARNENLLEAKKGELKKENDAKNEKLSSRLTLRFDEKELEVLSKVMTNLKESKIFLNLNRVLKYVIKNTDPEALSKQMVKSKKQLEEIEKKLIQEKERIWI